MHPRQHQAHGGALSLSTLEGDGSAMFGNDGLGNRQPQTDSRNGTLRGGPGPKDLGEGIGCRVARMWKSRSALRASADKQISHAGRARIPNYA